MKRNTEPISQTCLRCGGLHFGSYRCPYLDVAVCFACLKTIAAESGSDPHVHPNRKYDAIGRVYHAGCPCVYEDTREDDCDDFEEAPE